MAVVAEVGGGGDLFFEDGAGDGDVVDIAVDEGGLGCQVVRRRY
jgi:hypothetical protein